MTEALTGDLPALEAPFHSGRKGKATGADVCRIHYNLAVAYNNLAYLDDPPELPRTQGPATHIGMARDHCLRLLRYVLTGEVTEGEPERLTKEFRELMRLPAVTLAAGISAIHDAIGPAEHRTQPSPRWRRELACSGTEGALEELLTTGAVHVDLVDWMGDRIYSLAPRAAYNMACYWALVDEDRYALAALGGAAADEKARSWAVCDPALAMLQQREPDEFRTQLGLKPTDPQTNRLEQRVEELRAELREPTSASFLAAPFAALYSHGDHVVGELIPEDASPSSGPHVYLGWCGIEEGGAPARVELDWTERTSPENTPCAITVALYSPHRLQVGPVEVSYGRGTRVGLEPIPDVESSLNGRNPGFSYRFRATVPVAPGSDVTPSLTVKVGVGDTSCTTKLTVRPPEG